MCTDISDDEEDTVMSDIPNCSLIPSRSDNVPHNRTMTEKDVKLVLTGKGNQKKRQYSKVKLFNDFVRKHPKKTMASLEGINRAVLTGQKSHF